MTSSLPRFECVSGPATGRHIALGQPEIVLGRFTGCDVVFPQTYVSRRHARLTLRDGAYFVEDLESYHGTQVNGRSVEEPHQLKHNDRVQIGDHVLRYVSQPPEPSKLTTRDRPSTVMSVRDLLADEHNAQVKLRALLEIIHSLGVSLDARRLFPTLLDGVFRVFPQAQRGCILLAEESNGELIPHAVKERDDRGGRPSISRTIANQVMSQGQAVLSDNAGEDARFQSDSVYRLDLRSIMCAPLLGSDGEPLGMIQVDSHELERRFTREDLAVLANVANLAGRSVELARLHEHQLRFDRRQHDLETARRVQQHFLPQLPPEPPGYQIQQHYEAADEVGGDYFAYLPLPDGRWGLAIADVAGKGLPAALLMAHFCGDVRYCLAVKPQPHEAVQMLNQLLCDLGAYDRFVTFALCLLEPKSHSLTVVNAGHLHPLCRRASNNQVEPLGKGLHGPPLGVTRDWQYAAFETTLALGDTLLLYTDGVSDARNLKGQLYGAERVEQIMRSPLPAEELIDTLRADMDAFTQGATQADDICAVGLTRTQ